MANKGCFGCAGCLGFLILFGISFLLIFLGVDDSTSNESAAWLDPLKIITTGKY